MTFDSGIRRRAWLAAFAAAGLPACAGMHAAPDAPSADDAPTPDWSRFRIPGEFEHQRASWLGYHPALAEVTRMLIRALAPFTPLKFFVADEAAAAAVRALLAAESPAKADAPITVDPLAMYYLRDAAVFLTAPVQGLAVLDLRWTQYGTPGWCRKRHADDARRAAACAQASDLTRDALERAIARQLHVPILRTELALEGGGIESNGQGLLVANEALLRQRNPGLDRAALDVLVRSLPGVQRVLWLPEGLAEDPQQRGTILGNRVAWGTGGHTDEFVRFADGATLLLAWPEDADANTHPVARLNRRRMQRNAELLANARDTDGRALRVLRVPMPRIIERRVKLSADADQWSASAFAGSERRRDGTDVIQVASASYLNFVIANGVVVLPDYVPHGTPRAVQDRVQTIFEQAFPGRALRWVDALALNWLGGGLHCATLHEPAPG